MHLDDRLRSLKELIDEKSEMAGHLSRDINSGNQMAMYLEMHSMNNRDIPDEFEDKAEREAASRRKIDRTVSTMNKMVQTKEAKSRAALKELLERDGSKLKAYLDRASCLVQMIRELQAAQASGGDTSSIEQELHGALTKRTQGARRPVPRARSQPLRWIAPARRSRSTSSPTPTPPSSELAEEESLFEEADAELDGLALSLKAPAATPATPLRCGTKEVAGPTDAASSADDSNSAPPSP